MTEIAPPRRRRPAPAPQKRGNVAYDAELVYEALSTYDGAATNIELATILGIAPSTFSVWLKKYPEFKAKVFEMRAAALQRVHSALYKRAVGYEAPPEVTMESIPFTDPDTGETGTRLVEVKRVIKHVAADPTSGKFLLALRDPENWTERKVIAIEGTLRDTLAAVAKNLELELDPEDWEELTDGK